MIKILFSFLWLYSSTFCNPLFLTKNAKNPTQNQFHTSELLPDHPGNVYTDLTVNNLPLNQTVLDSTIFHLFSHGRPGELLLGGRWQNAVQIANFLKNQKELFHYRHLNIYGCEFAKGKRGKLALAYLQKVLSISISASNDITGKDGDWILEEGVPVTVTGMENYAYNLQCTTCSGAVGGTGVNDDFDGDGVCNLSDVDDDNDGIPDDVECSPVSPVEFRPPNWTAVTSGADINNIDPADIFVAANSLVVNGQNYDSYFQLISENRLVGTAPAITTALVGGRLQLSNIIPSARDNVIYEIFFVKSGEAMTNIVEFDDITIRLHDLDNGAVGGGAAPNYTDIGAFVTSVTAPYSPVTVGSNLQSYTYGTNTGYGLLTSMQSADNNASLATLPASNTISAKFSQKGKYRMLFGIQGTRTSAINDRGSVLSFQFPRVCDTDHDGNPDKLDFDSDNDGIPDAYESGCTALSTTLTNCHLSLDASAVDENGCPTGAATTVCSSPVHSDADGVPDYLDTDSDGDLCSDAAEAGTSSSTVNNSTDNTYTAPSATSDGLTNAGCVKPANDNWMKAGVSSACPLPVTLINFKVSESLEGVRLTWNTSVESNFDHFEIEKADGELKNYSLIGKVAGGQKTYSFTDKSKMRGTLYYRLKMVDRDGTFRYSRIVALQLSLVTKVYPNPAQGRSVFIEIEKRIDSYAVTDISGRKIEATLEKKINGYKLTLNNLATPGIYIVDYQTAKTRRKIKFILAE